MAGLPGIGLWSKRTALAAAAGRAYLFCLICIAMVLEHDGRWRFTPPAQATAALVAGAAPACAIQVQRGERWRNGAAWSTGRALGLETYLQDERRPACDRDVLRARRPQLRPERLFELMWQQGFAMFRGRLTPEPTFRIGCMGAIDEAVMHEVVRALATSLAAMGVRDCRPAVAPAAAE
jgi:2-aminoethylphosphonate-pyruvate transaminase